MTGGSHPAAKQQRDQFTGLSDVQPLCRPRRQQGACRDADKGVQRIPGRVHAGDLVCKNSTRYMPPAASMTAGLLNT